ncbi:MULTISPECIES: ATP-binding protein [unclassified Spirillospora]|uniref:ATP-binding protein n=1 Tax=unclassified Spirillospora TaxID=2642701 RepID=UPI00372415A1
MDPLTAAWTASPTADESRWFRAEEDSAAAGARREITALARRLGFAGERLGQVQLAATEAATNLVKHAERGEMLVRIVRSGTSAALEIVSIDHGPGIADLTRSRLGGYSTTGTLGLGLGSIERLADSSGLSSLPGVGTTLFARFRQPDAVRGAARRPEPEPAFAGLTRPMDGERECGDAYAATAADGTVYAMLCDGLGHGPLAARAAQEAVRALRDTALPARPAEILGHVHHRLRPTRGAAVAVAVIEPDAGRVRFAGLGNIAGWILQPDRRTGMISVPGIAGTHTRFREQVYELPPGAAVVMHSDGLTSRWDAAGLSTLAGRDPILTAATVLRDAGVRHDDRCVLAVTTSEAG